MCACRLRHPECNAHASYCGLWPVRLYSIFFVLSHKGHDFSFKKVTEHENVFFFSRLLPETFVILKIADRDKVKNVNFLDGLSKNAQLSPNVKTSRFSHADGQMNRRTDRHDEANNRFSKFYVRA